MELLELKGIKYISNPRCSKRGGGVAIAVNLHKFTLSKLNVYVPTGVEAVWGLLKPKEAGGKFTSILLCSFYSPPDKGKNTKLVNHLAITLHNLLNIHKNAGILICGDRNHIEIPSLLSIDPVLRQLVLSPTHGQNILDIICSNLETYYQRPIILPPLAPDLPDKASPSDHFGVELLPIINGCVPERKKVVKLIRPLPESLIMDFGQKIAAYDFEAALYNLPVDQMVSKYEEISSSLLNSTFPEKRVISYDNDKPWFTEKLRLLKRQRLREYTKNGKSQKYLHLKENFDLLLKEEIAKYKEKIKNEVLEGRRGSTYPMIKRIGAQPHSLKKGFQLPDHAAENYSNNQSAEIIADHFAKISQDLRPLRVEDLPDNVRQALESNDVSEVPFLSTWMVRKRLMKAKKPLGVVPGDLPRKLVKTFPDEIAAPATLIFNEITRTASYPKSWKIEYQVAIPKIFPPENLDDLRNIAKTPFLSKLYESFVAEWLLGYIKPYLDPNQCGLKGSSITHYLIKLLHFIHKTLDMRKPQAVLSACIDLSKAYNRVDHSLVIQDLFDMHTPSWLLKIIASYLSQRTMSLTFKDAQSTRKELPAGSPQGAFLGGLIFMIKFNGAFLRPSIPRNIFLQTAPSIAVKFVDDGSVAVGIDLERNLLPDASCRPQPLKFRERCGLFLPHENNPLQHIMIEAENLQ